MKNSLSLFIFLAFALNSCHTSKEAASTETPSDTPVVETPILGGDSDEHGCKHSAGYNWSQLQKECVRIFEAGTSFEAISESQAFSAFAILSKDLKQIELFLPNSKNSLVLSAVKTVLDNSKTVIFENKSENIEIVQSKTDFTIKINKTDTYKQNYSKEYGLGNKL